MNRLIRTSIVALCGILLSASVLASDGAIGIWQTQPSDEGSYLHVEIAPCEAFLCGTILAAYDSNNEIVPEADFIGKKMIWGMKPKSTNSWKSGKIWAPDVDKTYKSKMEMKGANLVVSGCVAGGLICRSQNWTRVTSP